MSAALSAPSFSLNTPHARALFAVGLCALLVFAPVFCGAVYLIHKAMWAAETVEAGEPRLARLQGLREAAGRVSAARHTAEESLARLTYPASTPADRVGADLQQRMRAVADSVGVAVAGSQVINVKEANGLEQIPVSLNLEASHEELRQFLVAVSAQTQAPAVYVDNLVLTPTRNRSRPGRLQVQARFSVLRRLQ
ncbi:hypothetical protein AGMMS49543_10410 [Betaproteobacteria bacterium]|nr:hypothetical protein AGMMS49543_10410 [Betaproteobacteria bacterium]GHU20114.1 hypothetical protein AGMMS50243_13800 [Betaproteobacteria bacterium]